MKKLLLGLTLIMIICFFCAGCQSERTVEDNVESISSENNSDLSENDSTDMLDQNNMSGSDEFDQYIANFKDSLCAKGLLPEKESWKDAESIGAVAGYGLNINNSGIEIYLFDPLSNDEKTINNLKTAKESSYITIYGTEINGKVPAPACTFYENMVLIFPAEDYGINHPNKKDIIESYLNTAFK